MARPDLQTVQKAPDVRDSSASLGKASAVNLQVWDSWRSKANVELKNENMLLNNISYIDHVAAGGVKFREISKKPLPSGCWEGTDLSFINPTVLFDLFFNHVLGWMRLVFKAKKL